MSDSRPLLRRLAIEWLWLIGCVVVGAAWVFLGLLSGYFIWWEDEHILLFAVCVPLIPVELIRVTVAAIVTVRRK